LGTLRRVVKKQEMPYYISSAGIRREFKKAGLILQKQRLFNTYPPFGFSSTGFLLFENTLGRVLKIILGRVRLVAFQKTKI
jgi:hypothetical protein